MLLTFVINPPAPHFVLAIFVIIWLSAVCPFWWIEARFCFLTATGTSMTIKRLLISLIVKIRSISEVRISPAGWVRMPKQKGCSCCHIGCYGCLRIICCTSCLIIIYCHGCLIIICCTSCLIINILSWLFEKKGLRANN